MANEVSVRNLVDAMGLTVLIGKEYLDDKKITTSDISRPGLELTGYFNFYPKERIQLFGMTEHAYANGLTHENRLVVMNQLATDQTPCFVVSNDLDVPLELLEIVKERHIPILISKLTTSRLSSNMVNYLEARLSERQSIHGVLVDIYGLGVMITGDSGVGKSETALELIRRGHRLIADDRVDVFQKDEETLVGEAPAILKHLLEIRGIGIIDIMNLFGAGAVRDDTDISLIIHLENWSPDKQFDRLGNGEEFVKIFDVNLPKISVPVKTGRNLAIIIEVAAMNFRAKTMGYDATKVFEDNLNGLIQTNSKKD
ncbi:MULTISPECIES: HPr(Ser) kinase/phosphatase [Dellaglioa]|uniref:HPr kinase/phosphorylase n=1 Tax=Dellaglioa carnosa TaxID=2995136 RepID=A0ABT4JJV1_9LACO|nr:MULTISPECIES: HPr(Ser) kinase/phosphatase [Dellaglioa]MCZ2490565.1 HPr(Ser) kinase/phosphatase [Dellaglioa carnosa]MCZ2492194.1 HPr(Ser) kinase/phosphatase [Dellaglioa carnosa]MCZ2493643.1 HPr(Ser) kinase/phosphatase [Dellaglioa carnosa]MDK1724700.1 HPr(Ser) kinase/phosphatase [Dellaglioa algida]MDK1730507.1 HPr(Ser) kinase/phosphatase [Dellaglioa carnosa]